MRLVYVWPVHVLHIVFHAALVVFISTGFSSSFQPPDQNQDDETAGGPGGKMRFATTWVIATHYIFWVTSLAFDIAVPYCSRPTNLWWKAHLNRFYVLMFATSTGMGGLANIKYVQACKDADGCPDYWHGLWQIHVLPLWYALLEFLLVPHETSTEVMPNVALVLCWCFCYLVQALMVRFLSGTYPYGDPWSAGQWILFFCMPALVFVERLLQRTRSFLAKKCGVTGSCYAQNAADYWQEWSQNAMIGPSTPQSTNAECVPPDDALPYASHQTQGKPRGCRRYLPAFSLLIVILAAEVAWDVGYVIN